MDFRGDDGITRRMAVLEQRVQAMRDHDLNPEVAGRIALQKAIAVQESYARAL